MDKKPGQTSGKSKQCNFRLSSDVLSILMEEAVKQGKNRTELLEEAVKGHFASQPMKIFIGDPFSDLLRKVDALPPERKDRISSVLKTWVSSGKLSEADQEYARTKIEAMGLSLDENLQLSSNLEDDAESQSWLLLLRLVAVGDILNSDVFHPPMFLGICPECGKVFRKIQSKQICDLVKCQLDHRYSSDDEWGDVLRNLQPGRGDVDLVLEELIGLLDQFIRITASRWKIALPEVNRDFEHRYRSLILDVVGSFISKNANTFIELVLAHAPGKQHSLIRKELEDPFYLLKTPFRGLPIATALANLGSKMVIWGESFFQNAKLKSDDNGGDVNRRNRVRELIILECPLFRSESSLCSIVFKIAFRDVFMGEKNDNNFDLLENFLAAMAHFLSERPTLAHKFFCRARYILNNKGRFYAHEYLHSYAQLGIVFSNILRDRLSPAKALFLKINPTIPNSSDYYFIKGLLDLVSAEKISKQASRESGHGGKSVQELYENGIRSFEIALKVWKKTLSELELEPDITSEEAVLNFGSGRGTIADISKIGVFSAKEGVEFFLGVAYWRTKQVQKLLRVTTKLRNYPSCKEIATLYWGRGSLMAGNLKNAKLAAQELMELGSRHAPLLSEEIQWAEERNATQNRVNQG